MRLTLVRHGQTPSNVLGLLDTAAPGPGLTELGREQAAALHGVLSAAQLDAIYHSRLVRTLETAQPLAEQRGIDLVELPGVQEVEAGDLELRGDEDAVRAYMRTVFDWGLGELGSRIPGGPDGYEFFGRYDSDIARVASEAQRPVLFSHGAAIRIWVAARATNIEPEFTAIHHLPNTGVVELEGSPDAGWTLLSWPGAEVPTASDRDPIDREFGLADQ